MADSRATVDDVRRVLEGVVDPELGGNIVELGMVRDIALHGTTAIVTVALTISGCPLRGQIEDDVTRKVASLPGIDHVDVRIGAMSGPERSELMAKVRWRARESAPGTEVPGSTRVLGVGSGKGGVGKSSITVNIAAAMAASGRTVGLLDADIWGFSVPRMLGVEARLGGTDGKIVPISRPVGAGTLKVISMGFLVEEEDQALMWRGLILTKAVEQFLTDVRWGDMDYLMIDLPPGTGDIQMGIARFLPQTELVIVTTPNVAAQKVAARAANMAARSYLRVAGVIENMSWFEAPDGTRHEIFGAGGGDELARDIGVPLLGQVPIEPEVGRGGDTGVPVVIGRPESPAAKALQAVADRIMTEILPPVEMSGCTARMEDIFRSLPPAAVPASSA